MILIINRLLKEQKPPHTMQTNIFVTRHIMNELSGVSQEKRLGSSEQQRVTVAEQLNHPLALM